MIKLVNQIGTTETYDPSYDYSWVDNLRPVNIIITKCLTDKMIDALMSEDCLKSCILHLTCTGLGGQFLEPNVPELGFTLSQLDKLLLRGFPGNRIVLRLDPIIPNDGCLLIHDQVLRKMNRRLPDGFRCRVSVLDVYNHVRERFNKYNLSSYWLPNGFQYNDEDFHKVDQLLSFHSDHVRFESCAEPKLTIPKKVGCVSQKDIDLVNPEFPVTIGDVTGKQRSTCLCPNNKVNIIKRRPSRCPNACIYCYWKN